ncbi:MAG: hypothetical protein HY744_32065 [Deltaproteobacteria bacterium]|nr:hypothetical protein [Deltaproteobacteria bacterium]
MSVVRWPVCLAVLCLGTPALGQYDLPEPCAPEDRSLSCHLCAARSDRLPGRDEDRSRFSVRAFSGGAFRQLFSVPIWAAELDLSAGGYGHYGGGFGHIGALLGSTEYGLRAKQLYAAGSYEQRVGRLGAGLSVQASYLSFARVSRSGVVDGWGLGLHFFGTYDLVASPGGHALFVKLRGGLDGFPHTPLPLHGLTLGLGWRWGG